MPSTIYLIRHGQSQANAGGVTLENPVVPLTELGERQARALAPLLPATPAQVWASPYKRAIDTAAPYCARMGQSPAIHADLREFETVDTVQMRGSSCAAREAIVEKYWLESDPDLRTGPQAETFREFHDRVSKVRTEFLPSLPDGSMIFGHGMWMALLLWQVWGFDQIDHVGMSLFRRFRLGFPVPNTVVYALTHVDPGEWKVWVDETAMRAIAAVGLEADRTTPPQPRLDIHDDAEHNVELEPAWIPPKP